ncbi:uncharacterized protein LOC109607779 [Aethina tumida]|uniref:uncharacterized protein LOC109607779 n=1 Tax=Aethina tumida TaxID=116153 RepID=UPI0021490E12|nr:uncharacterized protein LOC109607779 [Aethina tumida]
MVSVNILCLLALLVCATAFPYNVYRRSLPQKTIGGYYGHPLSRRSYDPPTMTMFAAEGNGDAVATNSFIGGQYGAPTQDEYASAAQEDYPIQANQQDSSFAVPEQTPIETPQEQPIDEQQLPVAQQPFQPFQPQEPVTEEAPTAEDEEEAIAPSTVKPKKTVRRKQKPKTVIVQEDDDDDQIAWPFGGRGYNAFFPISFGLTRSGGRQNQDEDGSYLGGSATAIANSFSTGKGGVASSHATAFGDPASSQHFLRKNLKTNKNLVNRHE